MSLTKNKQEKFENIVVDEVAKMPEVIRYMNEVIDVTNYRGIDKVPTLLGKYNSVIEAFELEVMNSLKNLSDGQKRRLLDSNAFDDKVEVAFQKLLAKKHIEEPQILKEMQGIHNALILRGDDATDDIEEAYLKAGKGSFAVHCLGGRVDMGDSLVDAIKNRRDAQRLGIPNVQFARGDRKKKRQERREERKDKRQERKEERKDKRHERKIEKMQVKAAIKDEKRADRAEARPDRLAALGDIVNVAGITASNIFGKNGQQQDIVDYENGASGWLANSKVGQVINKAGELINDYKNVTAMAQDEQDAKAFIEENKTLLMVGGVGTLLLAAYLILR